MKAWPTFHGSPVYLLQHCVLLQGARADQPDLGYSLRGQWLRWMLQSWVDFAVAELPVNKLEQGVLYWINYRKEEIMKDQRTVVNVLVSIPSCLRRTYQLWRVTIPFVAAVPDQAFRDRRHFEPLCQTGHLVLLRHPGSWFAPVLVFRYENLEENGIVKPYAIHRPL